MFLRTHNELKKGNHPRIKFVEVIKRDLFEHSYSVYNNTSLNTGISN